MMIPAIVPSPLPQAISPQAVAPQHLQPVQPITKSVIDRPVAPDSKGERGKGAESAADKQKPPQVRGHAARTHGRGTHIDVEV